MDFTDCTILLYYTVLYFTVLYCTVLYCTVLYCTVLYCTVLYCTVLYCTVLYCTVLYCTAYYTSVYKCNALDIIKRCRHDVGDSFDRTLVILPNTNTRKKIFHGFSLVRLHPLGKCDFYHHVQINY